MRTCSFWFGEFTAASISILLSLAQLVQSAAATSTADAVPTIQYNVTGVSGYWRISSKHSHADYMRWWGHSLRVNAPYIFYYSNETDRAAVEEIRKGLPTTFIQRDLHSKNFSSIHRLVPFSPNWTHPMHVPSVDLARMWIGKVSLMADAARLNPYNTSWFAWLDAGLASYRDVTPPAQPWPNPEMLASLPKDKIIYTDSGERVNHDVAGTAFMYHRSIVEKVEQGMRDAFEACANEEANWHCGTDQVLFTRMKVNRTDFFHKIGEGYGNVVNILY